MAESTAGNAAAGTVTGGVRVVLRLEGAALLTAAAAAYFALGHPWWLFLVLFLAPDLSFLGYLANARVGAAAYNAAHASLGPLALGAFGLAAAMPLATALALIWAAHVGFDRALGYGLKYATGFGFTHLGRIGRLPG
jgi:hypothetical protein